LYHLFVTSFNAYENGLYIAVDSDALYIYMFLHKYSDLVKDLPHVANFNYGKLDYQYLE